MQIDPTAPGAGLIAALDVGDPRRARIGRAVIGSLATAALFLGFTLVAKEAPPLYARAPWADDPYDTFVSFAIFFLPLLVGLALLRVGLCRRAEPLPLARLAGLMRASKLAIAVVLSTAVADWLSVALREHQAAWDSTTGILVGLLALATVAAGHAALDLRRASRELPRPAGDAAGPDWLADSLALGTRLGGRLGPLAPPAVGLVRAIDRGASRAVRGHPMGAAAVFSVAFGLSITASFAVAEGVGAVLGLFFGVVTCGMFAFAVGAGAYLDLVRAERPLQVSRRRLADALVLASAAVPVALAFRSSLLWMIGSSEASAGLDGLAILLAMAALFTFAGVLVVETLAGTHGAGPRVTRRQPGSGPPSWP